MGKSNGERTLEPNHGTRICMHNHKKDANIMKMSKNANLDL